jgi:hypothetical protein
VRLVRRIPEFLASDRGLLLIIGLIAVAWTVGLLWLWS